MMKNLLTSFNNDVIYINEKYFEKINLNDSCVRCEVMLIYIMEIKKSNCIKYYTTILSY